MHHKGLPILTLGLYHLIEENSPATEVERHWGVSCLREFYIQSPLKEKCPPFRLIRLSRHAPFLYAGIGWHSLRILSRFLLKSHQLPSGILREQTSILGESLRIEYESLHIIEEIDLVGHLHILILELVLGGDLTHLLVVTPLILLLRTDVTTLDYLLHLPATSQVLV